MLEENLSESLFWIAKLSIVGFSISLVLYFSYPLWIGFLIPQNNSQLQESQDFRFVFQGLCVLSLLVAAVLTGLGFALRSSKTKDRSGKLMEAAKLTFIGFIILFLAYIILPLPGFFGLFMGVLFDLAILFFASSLVYGWWKKSSDKTRDSFERENKSKKKPTTK